LNEDDPASSDLSGNCSHGIPLLSFPHVSVCLGQLEEMLVEVMVGDGVKEELGLNVHTTWKKGILGPLPHLSHRPLVSILQGVFVWILDVLQSPVF
jgi:hypothetical protein